MSQNIFLCSAAIRPSTRWLEAFPDGSCRERDRIAGSVGEGDVLWVDTARPGWGELVATLCQTLPHCPIVVISMMPDSAEATAALDRGARGYCHAMAVPTLLRDVAVVVRHGGLWIGAELMSRVVGAAHRALPPAAEESGLPLSAREAEVAREVAAGRSNKEIAAKLGITERTVKAHLGAIFEKLRVRDRLQLVLRLSAHSDNPLPVQ